jgi:hypothetical protein
MTMCHPPGTQLGPLYYHDNYGCTAVQNGGLLYESGVSGLHIRHLSVRLKKRSVLSG